jgi:hypothetical protein
LRQNRSSETTEKYTRIMNKNESNKNNQEAEAIPIPINTTNEVIYIGCLE